MKLRYLFFLLAICVALSSCVAKKKYAALEGQRATLEQQYKEMMGKYNALESNYSTLNDQYKALGTKNAKLSDEYKSYQKSAQELAAMSNNELIKLNSELQDKLAKLEESNKKVQQLQAAMNKQQQTLKDLLNKITNALVGFSPDELTVELKNGKVYVSLQEQLLFKSGSAAVDPKGKQALSKVADVLNKQTDIDITVEGHTDTIPYKGAAGLDNWDLSVKRATSVLRILTEDYHLDPTKVVAAGRGEHFPIGSNSTPAGRAKNRRTEIILTPKLEEIMKILQTSGAY
jgi:chemotaxis protein MotB